MNISGFEIERKFLIAFPEKNVLALCSDVSEITQTYLNSGEKGMSERVRRRGHEGSYVYTHTRKTRLSDLRRIELEDEISESEYNELLSRADSERRTVEKTRYLLPYEGQVFEIDVYPFWSDRAIMELELAEEGQRIDFPPFITILKEVTSDKRYTNASIAKRIPEERKDD